MNIHQLPYTTQTRNAEETFRLASDFARVPLTGDVVLLQGKLGAGKTQFVRGFCAGLGLVDLFDVDSPTYTLVNHYDVAPGVDHIDLYRCENETELEEIGLAELLDSSTIKLIEWPERLERFSPQKSAYWVRFQITGEQTRRITIAVLDQESA